MRSPDELQEWAFIEGQGSVIQRRTRRQVWDRYLKPEVAARLHCLTGPAHRVMDKWREQGKPGIDFCFVDAGHEYWEVKHDFMAAAETANPGCIFVLDDYTERPGYGVKRLVDDELRSRIPAGCINILDTGFDDRPYSGLRARHYMAMVETESLGPIFIERLFPKAERRKFRVKFAFWRFTRDLQDFLRHITGRR